jgi:hypothetical protein
MRPNPLGTAATTALLYQPQIMVIVELLRGWRFGRGNRSTARKSAPVPFCSRQIPHELIRARTLAAVVGILNYGTASPKSYSIVSSRGYRSDRVENTIPVLLFTVIT